MENSTFCLTGLLQADSEAGETAATGGGRKRGSRRPEVWLSAEPPVSILRGGRGKVSAGRDAPDKCQGLVSHCKGSLYAEIKLLFSGQQEGMP